MDVRLEEDHPSIVVLGAFDPRLLHPQWFRAEKLLGASEAEHADVKIIHSDIADWSTETLNFQATRDRMVVQGKVESAAVVIRDFVVGILDILDRTPATQLGLNRSMHFDVGGEDNWHKVGDHLTPKEIWRRHLPARPGLRTLQIEEARRPDGLPGMVVVTIQPSVKYRHGVFFDVNNSIANSDPDAAAASCRGLIQDHWERLLEEAKYMATSILGEVLR